MIDIKTLGQVDNNYIIDKTIDDAYILKDGCNITIKNGAYATIYDYSCDTNINYKISESSTLKLFILNTKNVKRAFDVDGELLINEISFEGTNEDLLINLNKENASSDLKLLVVARNTKANFLQRVNHNNKNTYSNISNYGIAFDSSNIFFDTTGFISKSNSSSNCRQLSKGVVMDDESKITSKPILLIDEYDCFASHGAAIGKMSDEDMFYLMSRGLTKTEAFLLILNGIIRPFLDEIKDDEIKKEITEKVNSLM